MYKHTSQFIDLFSIINVLMWFTYLYKVKYKSDKFKELVVIFFTVN